MPRDPVRVADTRAWLDKASSDLRTAEVVLTAEPPLIENALFHCQQAVEKGMKGLITWHDLPFQKTHNLAPLARQCREVEPKLAPLLQKASALTKYAWKFRYPGEDPAPTLEQARAGLALAREVFQAILDRLPEDARP